MVSKLLQKTETKKVLLIDPRGFGSGLNLGLGYIAGILAKNGYAVKVIDCNNFPDRLSKGPSISIGNLVHDDWKTKVGQALEWEPEVIGVSINSFTQDSAYEITQFCREKRGDQSLYVAGGPHVSVFRSEFLEKNKHLFDFAIVGEGEETIVELLESLTEPEKVKGLIYCDPNTNEVRQTVDRPPMRNLDSLPFPLIEAFDTVSLEAGLHNYQLSSSRGCPYKCVFCSQILSRVWRPRSPEHVIAEIKMAKEKFRMSSITFWDDNFSLDVNRAKKICDLMKAENINLEYNLAGVRADRLDEELLQKLKDTGCKSIFIGIEDGDAETFPFVGKGESLEAIEKAVAMVKKFGIAISSYMITGLINSNYDSFLRSLAFVERIGIPAHWNIAFPLPRTDLYEWALRNGRFLMTVEEGFRHCMTSKNPPVVFDTPDYPKEARLKAYYVGNLRCRGYDMVIASRSSNLFRQALDIAEAVWDYDRERLWWHFSYLFKIFLKSVVNAGRL